MALKIRLARRGSKKRPFYHIVVAESASPRDGKYIKKLGAYNPHLDPAEAKIDSDQLNYWLSVGAKATERVCSILKKRMQNAE